MWKNVQMSIQMFQVQLNIDPNTIDGRQKINIVDVLKVDSEPFAEQGSIQQNFFFLTFGFNIFLLNYGTNNKKWIHFEERMCLVYTVKTNN